MALSSLIVGDVLAPPVLGSEKPATVTAQAAHPQAVTSSPVVATRAPTPTAAPTLSEPKTVMASQRPGSTTDSEALRSFRLYWGDIVRVSAAAVKAHDAAGEDLRTGHLVRASGELKSCQDTASGIVTYSSDLPLDIQHGSDLELVAAIKKVGDGLWHGCKSARSYLETNAASDFNEAKTRFSDVVDGIVQAEILARSRYQRMGGNPDTLPSFKTALQ